MDNTAPELTIHSILAAARAFYRHDVWRSPDEHRPDRYDLEMVVLDRITNSPEWLNWRQDTTDALRAEVQS